MLPPCLGSLRQPSRAQLVLSGPLSPRLDASQWISMSHSNAEKLMIKKEFFLRIIPHLRLLSTPSPRAHQPQPRALVMPRRWGCRSRIPGSNRGWETGRQRCLFHGASRLLLVAGSGTPGPCAIPAPCSRLQTQHLQHRTLIKSTLW